MVCKVLPLVCTPRRWDVKMLLPCSSHGTLPSFLGFSLILWSYRLIDPFLSPGPHYGRPSFIDGDNFEPLLQLIFLFGN